MKNIYLLPFAILFACKVFAQCPNTDITLATQAQVDNFKVTYPNCKEPSQFISVTGTGIIDLNGLSNLTKINLLNITNTSIINLSGLSNLTEANYVYIFSNFLLADINGLSSLTKVNKQLLLYDSFRVSSLAPLTGLTTLEELGIGGLGISNLNGLENITTLSSIGLTNCEFLTSLDALNNVKFVYSPVSSLALFGNPLLTDCVEAVICRASYLPADEVPVWVDNNGSGKKFAGNAVFL